MSQLFNSEKPELYGLILFWTVPVSYILNMCLLPVESSGIGLTD